MLLILEFNIFKSLYKLLCLIMAIASGHRKLPLNDFKNKEMYEFLQLTSSDVNLDLVKH